MKVFVQGFFTFNSSFARMIIERTVQGLRSFLERQENSSVGFVPTMGALHAGHVSLIRQCIQNNPVSVCSIFVNPKQFNNPDDLKNYPRTEDADVAILEQENCTVVFIPTEDEIYLNHDLLQMDFGLLERVMEGKFRSGHFRGVATVVKRLFEIVNPKQAYFGEKDFQQLAVIRAMTEQLRLKVKIIACPTVREPDGLALSSRNIHLTSLERKHAPVIYESLQHAKELFGENYPVQEIKNRVIQKVENNGLFRVEYFEIVDADTLVPLMQPEKKAHARGCIAVLTSATRLIDNLALN